MTSALPFWEGARFWVIARPPLSGFAETFSHAIAELAPGGGSDRPELDTGAEAVIFVVDGAVELRIGGDTHQLAAGGYAFLPPGVDWSVWNQGNTPPARFHWIRKAYEAVEAWTCQRLS